MREITGRLANALGVELIAAEAARPTEHPDALDYILRGRAVLLKPRTPDAHREAINLFEHALALDPKSIEAQGRLAGVLMTSVLAGWAASASADLARAEGLVDQALAVSPRLAFAHVVKGHVLRVQRRWEEAIPEYEAALSSNPNWLNSLHFLAACKMMTGSIEDAISLEQQAIRLGPRDPYIGNFYFRIGQAHLLLGRTDEAIVWFEKTASAIPGFGRLHVWLASAYALKGETERASSELTEAHRLNYRFLNIARLKAEGHIGGPGYWGVPKVRALFEATYFEGLRKAGVPEE